MKCLFCTRQYPKHFMSIFFINPHNYKYELASFTDEETEAKKSKTDSLSSHVVSKSLNFGGLIL